MNAHIFLSRQTMGVVHKWRHTVLDIFSPPNLIVALFRKMVSVLSSQNPWFLPLPPTTVITSFVDDLFISFLYDQAITLYWAQLDQIGEVIISSSGIPSGSPSRFLTAYSCISLALLLEQILYDKLTGSSTVKEYGGIFFVFAHIFWLCWSFQLKNKGWPALGSSPINQSATPLELSQ